MRKICLLLQMLLAMACGSAWGQAALNDPSRVYDTISDLDSCYFFTQVRPKPCINPYRKDIQSGNVLLQEYVTSDSLTVYGVAITFRALNNAPIFDYYTSFQGLLMKCLGPSNVPLGGNPVSMLPIDTVTLNRSHPRFCWFTYFNHDNDKCDSAVNCLTVPCYEMYFDTPKPSNVMTDTFYVGIEINDYDITFPQYYGGQHDTSLQSTLFWSPGVGHGFGCQYGYDYVRRLDYEAYNKLWGVAFPIIGFRCGPMKNYWLEEYMNNYAIVRWRSVEPGTMYNVRLVGEDGSDTTIVTNDTVYVFNGLSDSVRYNVMLRKQCHYCTSNYDTTVYGAWGDTIFFGQTILDTVWRTVTAASSDPAMGEVAGGGLYADSSTATLTAIPFQGYGFDSWGDGDMANPRQVLVVSDTSFTANFHAVQDTAGGDTTGIQQPRDCYFVMQPNPARGTVQILLPAAAMGGQLSLCDMAGRELEVRTVGGTTVEWNLSSLPTGAYLVKLTTPQGTAVQKLLLEP